MTFTITEKEYVETGNIQMNSKRIITTGLNTCIYIVIKTKFAVIGWHFSRDNMSGKNMERIVTIFNNIKDSFVSGYIIPGEDRQRDLTLHKDSRTMKTFPNLDPAESRDFLVSIISKYPWYQKLNQLNRIKNYKQFVIFEKSKELPYIIDDSKLFDSGCNYDAGK